MNDLRHLSPGEWIEARGGLWHVVESRDCGGLAGRQIKAAPVLWESLLGVPLVRLQAIPGAPFVPAATGEVAWLAPAEVEQVWAADYAARVSWVTEHGGRYWRPELSGAVTESPPEIEAAPEDDRQVPLFEEEP